MEFIESNKALILWNETKELSNDTISELKVIDYHYNSRHPNVHEYLDLSGGCCNSPWEEFSEVNMILEIFRIIHDGFIDNDVRNKSYLQF